MSFFISQAYAEGAAPAAGAGGDPTTSLLFFVGMIVIFYFLLIRPQQKRAKDHRKMVAAIGKDDEVVTNGGILGKIIEMGDQFITIEIADNVNVRIQRNAISTVLPKGSLKAAEKD
ncbi:Protein translocase subunit YajC [hydrothermal vent metagenome]|uniref:Protein translocase subunit YajC n=1 Tax=hydrothermal vent metagenome TaxID=652676 RepID=A0A3B0ZXJ2_9ZZZZ